MQWNGELLEGTIELVELRLRVHASSTGLDIVSHIPAEPWPVKLVADQSHCLSLTEVA